jgi:TonB family protein
MYLYEKNVFTLSFTIVASLSFFLHADTLPDQPPSLITNPYQVVPSDAIRKGIEGVTRAEVFINESGIVERCSVLTSVSTFSDSITVSALERCKFSPAISNNQAVPSSMEIELLYNPDSLVALFGDVVPIVSGRIISRKNDKPLKNATLTVQFLDTTEDHSLEIPFTKYCILVGKIVGQHFENTLFSTQTDSNGYFCFRLLPQGHVTLRAYNQKNEQLNIDTSIVGIQKIKLMLFSEDFEESDNQFEIEVVGKDAGKKIIDISKNEISNGMTHSMIEILKDQPSIRTSSQSKAKMIVRSASPYDNLYYIAGVPFYSPYHFGGYNYGEIDGIMINTLNKISVETDELAGRYPSVSGVLVKADPGINRAEGKRKSRPELNIELGSSSIDFLGSIKPKTHAYQIGISAPNSYSLEAFKYKNLLTNDALLGIGFPATFSNLTFTTQSKDNSVNKSFFSWLSFDAFFTYGEEFSYKEHFRPWGMASYSLSSTGKLNWDFSLGGSHQYFADGKRTGRNAYLTIATISNGALTFNVDEIHIGDIALDMEIRGEGRQWRGDVRQRDIQGDPVSFTDKSEEGLISLHGGLTKNFGDLLLKANLLVSSTIFESEPVFAADPGILLIYQPENWDAGFSVGKITSYPDFRGIPDKSFRKKRISSVVSSVPFHFNKFSKIKIGFQPFARWQDLCPQMDPEKFIWDTAATTKLLAKGAEASCEVQLAPWISFNTNVIVTDAQRRKNENDYIYEWDSPYTAAIGSHLTFLKERLHTYLNWQKRSGTFYYDFSTSQYKRLMPFDDYSVSFQLHNKVNKERFFTRFDGYVTVENFLDFPSIRNYYWDKENNKIPIISDRLFFHFGLKAAFRL